MKKIINEVETLASFDNEHILKFKNLFIHENFMFIFTEYMDMDLLDYVNMFGDQLIENDIK